MTDQRLIFVDCDGVEADFFGGVRRVWHRSDLVPDQYDLADQLGITTEEFWGTIDRLGPAFWSQLEPYPWAVALWGAAQNAGDAYILTQPSEHPACVAGKVEWIARELGTRRYLLAPYKDACSRPGALLIDDKPANCREWERRGGIAWLFPQPWNDSTMQAWGIINGLIKLATTGELEPLVA